MPKLFVWIGDSQQVCFRGDPFNAPPWNICIEKSQEKYFSPLIIMIYLGLNRQICFINIVFQAIKAFLLAEKIQEITIN